jgi:polyhydroxyalkanoate synthesis regulator phasin
MLDLLKKTILTGIGIASMTKDKVEELAKKIVKETKLSEEEGKKLRGRR